MSEPPVPEGLCPISFLDNLDACDLENYKHPPFMWILWYVSLLGKAVYDKVMELIEGNGEGGDGDDKGDKGGKKKDDEGGEEPPAEEEGGEEPAEEAPAEEEG